MKSQASVIFDFDGTLTEGYPKILYQGLSEYFYECHGKAMRLASPEVLVDHGCSGIEAFQGIFNLHGVDFSFFFEDFLPYFESIYHRQVKVCAWVPPVLKDLRKNSQKLVICSNNKEKNVRSVMNTSQRVIHHYHCLDDHRDTLKHKPAKESYISLERYHISLPKSVYITDEFRDAVGALDNGLGRVVLVTWGCSNQKEQDLARTKGIRVVDEPKHLILSIQTFLHLGSMLV